MVQRNKTRVGVDVMDKKSIIFDYENFFYDNNSDSVIITKNKEHKKLQSVNMGDLILDFDNKHNLLGVEVRHVRELLNMKDIESIEEADFKLRKMHNIMAIWLMLKVRADKHLETREMPILVPN